MSPSFRSSASPPTVTDADVKEALDRLAQQSRNYVVRPEGEPAQKDDTVTIDFLGSVDGVPFEGGKGEGFNLTLGSGQFIPGFEDQLIGAKAGESRDVKVTFPTEYHAADLAGKEAVFAVTVKEVKAPEDAKVDDALAQKLGMTDLGQLGERIRDQIKGEFAGASRVHLKRRVLDALDEAHSFLLPPAMVDSEFENIWAQVQAELKREGKTAADEGSTEEEMREEYRRIAERRVRLGLVLGKLGEQNGITVAPDEVQRAIAAQARQFPGQEQQVYELYAKNQQAQAEIRAPLFEDKVVDFIAELAQVTDKKVDKQTLFQRPGRHSGSVRAAINPPSVAAGLRSANTFAVIPRSRAQREGSVERPFRCLASPQRCATLNLPGHDKAGPSGEALY